MVDYVFHSLLHSSDISVTLTHETAMGKSVVEAHYAIRHTGRNHKALITESLSSISTSLTVAEQLHVTHPVGHENAG
jgi:hypothetical protein